MSNGTRRLAVRATNVPGYNNDSNLVEMLRGVFRSVIIRSADEWIKESELALIYKKGDGTLRHDS